ncbi:MAG: hypothetical protein ACC618_00630 [Patescibacteria group bacterium]
MFTLGYFFGVVITLKVFGQKDKVRGYQPINSALNSEKEETLSSWEIFTQLTKPNHPAGFRKENKEISEIPSHTPGVVPGQVPLTS